MSSDTDCALAERAPGCDTAEYFGGDEPGIDSALIVVKRGPNAGSRFHLGRYTLTAGRHPNSDIFLDDVTASRRHAEFHCAGGRFWVTDLSSLNGTYLNHTPVQSAALSNGDEILIGKFELMFLTEG